VKDDSIKNQAHNQKGLQKNDYIRAMERIYLDTSVFGGYFDPEFEIWTKILFDKITQREYKVIFSKLTDIELAPAPEKVRNLASNLPVSQLEFIEISDESVELAEQYLNEKVVGKTSRADCIHIALATLHNADILVSWNFKHIVNVNRIRGYNAVNFKFGHKILEIRTPREILAYED
jgi:predicted nucleic acid-binding protein